MYTLQVGQKRNLPNLQLRFIHLRRAE